MAKAKAPRLEPFLLRLPPDLRRKLVSAAIADNRSLSNMIVHALHQWADDYEKRTVRTVRTDQRARDDG